MIVLLTKNQNTKRDQGVMVSPISGPCPQEKKLSKDRELNDLPHYNLTQMISLGLKILMILWLGYHQNKIRILGKLAFIVQLATRH